MALSKKDLPQKGGSFFSYQIMFVTLVEKVEQASAGAVIAVSKVVGITAAVTAIAVAVIASLRGFVIFLGNKGQGYLFFLAASNNNVFDFVPYFVAGNNSF